MDMALGDWNESNQASCGVDTLSPSNVDLPAQLRERASLRGREVVQVVGAFGVRTEAKRYFVRAREEGHGVR